MENDTKKAAHLHSGQPSIDNSSVQKKHEAVNPNYEKEEEFFQMANVQSTEVDWLWFPYIPKGKIVLLEADPGTGKTYLTLWITAVISSGGHFFREPEAIHREPANVVFQTGEDGLSDTIKPRLESMIPSPDMQRIFVIREDQKALTLSDGRIERALQRFHPKLFVLDPLQNYIGAEVDMHRANEVRPILARIAMLAEKYDCTFFLVMHMNKNAQGSALYRALGSIDIPAVARSMLFLGINPENKRQRILCHEKSSLANKGESLTFTIDPQRGGIVWSNASSMSADDILRIGMGERQKPSATLDEAVQQLRGLLGEKGAITLEQVETLQKASGISRATIHRAKDELKLQTVGVGRPPHRETWWVSPDINIEEFKVSIRKVIELHPDDSTAET